MSKVATLGSLASSWLQIGGVGLTAVPMVKRKTPSELRGEQLKRTNKFGLIDESVAPVLGSISNDNCGLRKQNLSRKPRYVDTRLDEVFPVKKSRVGMLSVKEPAKETIQSEQHKNLNNINVLPSLAAKKQQLSCLNNTAASAEVFKDDGDGEQAFQTIEKCSQSIFRSVTEISSRGERSFSLEGIDMNKALKGLVACEPSTGSGLAPDSSEKHGSLLPAYSEISVPGQKAPLDFTLKTKVRVTSTCSVNWMYRSILSAGYNGMPQLNSQFGCMENISGLGQTFTSQIICSKALHSWVYPQSVLPPSVISVLNSSVTDSDFLGKRQVAWEDSFRSLYFMLRRNACSLFYVCTSRFVVMFTSGDSSGRVKHVCNAYISQSTRGLRSLLREHDVCFSTPLSDSKVEQPNTEDLVELSEIEKLNLGQTRQPKSLSDMDNSPQSLLAFHGNKNVQALYDFLLNYRSLLTYLSGVDVPALYSPIPFQNAAISAPEVRCVEVKKADNITSSHKETEERDGDSGNDASTAFCSSIEIKDSYIPPWIISRICALVGSDGRTFEASFATESSSISLNFALNTFQEKSRSQIIMEEDLQEGSYALGVPEVTVCQRCSSGYLKGLKYKDNSYTASMSIV